MVRAFTDADVVQSNTGTTAGVSGQPGVGLTSPADAGNSGVVIIGGATPQAAPEQWDFTVGSSASGAGVAEQLGIMCRPCLPSGDQSWTFLATGGAATFWTWVGEEWTNLSYAPILVTARYVATLNPASITIGPTGSWGASEFVVGVAAVFFYNSAPGGSTWPTLSWSGGDGFTQTQVLESGTGSTAGDVKLWVARRYGTAGETGGWQTTATLTGTQTSKTGFGCLAVFRAESLEGDL